MSTKCLITHSKMVRCVRVFFSFPCALCSLRPFSSRFNEHLRHNQPVTVTTHTHGHKRQTERDTARYNHCRRLGSVRGKHVGARLDVRADSLLTIYRARWRILRRLRCRRRVRFFCTCEKSTTKHTKTTPPHKKRRHEVRRWRATREHHGSRERLAFHFHRILAVLFLNRLP